MLLLLPLSGCWFAVVAVVAVVGFVAVVAVVAVVVVAVVAVGFCNLWWKDVKSALRVLLS